MNGDEKLALAAALSAVYTADLAVLFELLSMEQLLKLMIVFGGRSVDIPKVSAFTDGIEAAQIAYLAFRTKTGVAAIAEEMHKPHLMQQAEVALLALKQQQKVRPKLNNRERELLRKIGA